MRNILLTHANIPGEQPTSSTSKQSSLVHTVDMVQRVAAADAAAKPSGWKSERRVDDTVEGHVVGVID